MNKIRFFFLQVLFLCTPLVYAWLYIPYIQGNLADIAQPTLLNINLFLAFITQPFLSLPFIGSLFFNTFTEVHWSGFESTKVSFMLFTTAIVLCFSVLPLLRSKIKIDKTFLIGVLIVAVWAVCSYILNKDTNPYFFSGNPEKTHGLYFSLALFMLFWVLFSLSKVEKKNLLFVSFIAFFGVALYAFFQKLGLDPLRQLYNTRLDLWRIFSTLGNPNYLAGYVLMILPLLRVYRFKNELSWQEHLWEVFVWVLSGVLIYWTGSYLAWVLFAGYVGYVIVEHLISDRKQRRIFWIFFGIFLMFAISWVWHNYQSEILAAQKMKGFIARWYLWYTGIAALKHDVGHFLFGFGPDGFLSVSAKFRHPLLSVYEDPAYRIDRSHNVFIDFALNFGVPLSLIIFWFIADSLKHLSHDKKVSLFIFALYFSFNIPVIVHFLLLIQIFSSIEKPR